MLFSENNLQNQLNFFNLIDYSLQKLGESYYDI